MARESKAELMDRLRREGRWDEFKRRREELKAQGVPAKQAWYQAAVEFPPEHLIQAASTLIPWPQARRSVNAAKSNLSWLLCAMDVDVPPKVGARRPSLYSFLKVLRSNPIIRRDFFVFVVEQLAKNPKLFKNETSTKPKERPWWEK